MLEKGCGCRRGDGNEHRTLVGAEEALVIAVGRDVWFEGRREGGEEVAPETGEQENGRVVTGRERVDDDRINVVLQEVVGGVRGWIVVGMGSGMGQNGGFVRGTEGAKDGDGEVLKVGR